jgi:chromosome segregation ATPase
MFNQSTSADTKIAVLEERLSSYEVMMKKIDEAIQIMGKTSQNISKMLAVHEEKIEHTIKSDELLLERVKGIEIRNTEEHGKVIRKIEEFEEKINQKIEDIESKVDNVMKFRWIAVGALAIITFLVSAPHIATNILTPDQQDTRIEAVK